MATPVVIGDSAVVQRTNTYAAAVMLRHAMPTMILDKTATVIRMPKNKGEKITMRRPVIFTAATAPLVEGITPTGRKITFVDVEATLKQYGDYVRFSDKIADLHEDSIGEQISIQNGENVGRTLEALNWGVARAGTNVFYANGSARTDVNTPLSLTKQHKVIRSLQAQKGAKFTRILSPSPDFETRGIEASYIAVAHTDLGHDIRALPGFIPTASYGTRSVLAEEEIGSVEDVRYILSADLEPFVDAGGAKLGMVSTTGTSADVYPIVYFAKDAWVVVVLRDAGAITVTSQMPGKPSDTDPLGQRGFLGWKTYHAAKIVNEAWLGRLEVGVTAL